MNSSYQVRSRWSCRRSRRRTSSARSLPLQPHWRRRCPRTSLLTADAVPRSTTPARATRPGAPGHAWRCPRSSCPHATVHSEGRALAGEDVLGDHSFLDFGGPVGDEVGHDIAETLLQAGTRWRSRGFRGFSSPLRSRLWRSWVATTCSSRRVRCGACPVPVATARGNTASGRLRGRSRARRGGRRRLGCRRWVYQTRAAVWRRRRLRQDWPERLRGTASPRAARLKSK